jgi:hypothetical protein
MKETTNMWITLAKNKPAIGEKNLTASKREKMNNVLLNQENAN